jgi:MFS family permease
VGHLRPDLHTGSGAIEWVVAGYGLTYASFLIMAGRIGDHIGRRRLLTIGLLLFVLSSVACGVAAGLASLVAARLVQGLAAAMISRHAQGRVIHAITLDQGRIARLRPAGRD